MNQILAQEKFPQKPSNKSFIDQVCLVKMAWYRSPFFVTLWTLTPSRSITRKKRTWPISSYLDFTPILIAYFNTNSWFHVYLRFLDIIQLNSGMMRLGLKALCKQCRTNCDINWKVTSQKTISRLFSSSLSTWGSTSELVSESWHFHKNSYISLYSFLILHK